MTAIPPVSLLSRCPPLPPARPASRRLVLVVDDNPADRDLYLELLSQDGRFDYEFVVASSGHQTLELFRVAEGEAVPFDVVLLDYRLPDMAGTEVLEALHRLRPRELLPVVMLTGVGNEAVAVEAMKRGAVDYLTKGDLNGDLLRRAVDHAVESVDLRRQLRRKQCELAEAQRHEVRLRDEFLAQVSHELRTPLSVVYRFVDMMLDGVGGSVNPEQREYLEIARRNCIQLRRMIGDLLESARAREGKLDIERTAVDLRDLVEEVVRERQADAATAEVELAMAGGESLPVAWADPARVRQVLGNLLDNALKFTAPGGQVTAVVELDPASPGFLRLAVRDTGRGIPADRLDGLFERLHQVQTDVDSRGGLGFGLYIARRIVELHGGRIGVDSVPGEGSTFHVALPIFSPDQVLRPVVSGDGRLPPAVDLVRLEVRADENEVPVDGELHDRLATGLRRLLSGRPATLLPVHTRPDVFWIASADRDGSGDTSRPILGELRDWLAAPAGPAVRPLIEEVSLPSRPQPESPLPEQLNRLGDRIAELIAYRERRSEPAWNARRSSSSKTTATSASA